MSITYGDQQASLIDIVTVEDAEGLLEWLQTHPDGKLDLAACTHLHAANMQVLMAAKPIIAAWPTDAELAIWLKNTLLKVNVS